LADLVEPAVRAKALPEVMPLDCGLGLGQLR
jgi:hypothetical protein